MQVQKINNSVYPVQNTSTPAFRAKGLDPEVIKALDKNSKGWARFLTYAGEHQGEMLNILVTAFGTAIVCPLFIRYNPFSKEDEKTRAYSAWRQPISAVIAVAAQLTITKWFNDYLAKMASTSDKDGNAHYKRADLRACPHERFLTHIIKYENPEWTDEQVAKEVKIRQTAAEKKEIAKQRALLKDTPIETKELLCQDYIEKAKSEIFKELKTEYKAEIESKFGKPVEDVGSIKLNKFLNKKLEEKALAAGKDVEKFVSERAEIIIEKEVTAETMIKSAIRRLKGKNISVPEAIERCNEQNLINFIKEHGLEEKIGKEFTVKEIADEIIRRLNIAKEFESANQMKDFASVKHLGNTYEEIKHNIKIKKLVKGKISDAKRVFKTQNTQKGLLVTLATLPLTCGLLNWAYPRIMEKIMPEMSAKKKANDVKVEKEDKDD